MTPEPYIHLVSVLREIQKTEIILSSFRSFISTFQSPIEEIDKKEILRMMSKIQNDTLQAMDALEYRAKNCPKKEQDK